MPAHSVLISPAQGLPACCATAAEPDSSSAVNITSPDRIPVILGSSVPVGSYRVWRDPAVTSLNHCNALHLRGLLCLCHERRCRRASHECDECASLHARPSDEMAAVCALLSMSERR